MIAIGGLLVIVLVVAVVAVVAVVVTSAGGTRRTPRLEDELGRWCPTAWSRPTRRLRSSRTRLHGQPLARSPRSLQPPPRYRPRGRRRRRPRPNSRRHPPNPRAGQPPWSRAWATWVGVLSLTGVVLLVARFWQDMGTGTQLALTGLTAAVLAGAGTAVPEARSASTRGCGHSCGPWPLPRPACSPRWPPTRPVPPTSWSSRGSQGSWPPPARRCGRAGTGRRSRRSRSALRWSPSEPPSSNRSARCPPGWPSGSSAPRSWRSGVRAVTTAPTLSVSSDRSASPSVRSCRSGTTRHPDGVRSGHRARVDRAGDPPRLVTRTGSIVALSVVGGITTVQTLPALVGTMAERAGVATGAVLWAAALGVCWSAADGSHVHRGSSRARERRPCSWRAR